MYLQFTDKECIVRAILYLVLMALCDIVNPWKCSISFVVENGGMPCYYLIGTTAFLHLFNLVPR